MHCTHHVIFCRIFRQIRQKKETEYAIYIHMEAIYIYIWRDD